MEIQIHHLKGLFGQSCIRQCEYLLNLYESNFHRFNIVAGFNLNSELLLPPFYKKNSFLVFLVHWLAWLLLHFITFLPTLLNISKIQLEPFLFTHVVLVTINFLLFYIVAFFIMTRMISLRKKWFWMLLASLLLAIVVTYLKFRLENWHSKMLLEKTSMFSKFPKKPVQESLGFFSYRFRTYFQTNILTNVSVVVVAFAYRLLLSWFQQEKIRKDLQNQKLQAELSFLKMQVNPHFLFNALNNIYSLAVIENCNKTGNSVLKLSDLMRYMLYEKEDEENKVSLDKEIKHINSYIDLEKLRHLEAININFSIEGETADKKIAPLLLFPLIENACKHGILNDPEKPVDILLQATNEKINFSIVNFNNDYMKDVVGGIGISNVKKRLDLLYGDRYSLDINKTDEKFNVNLSLPLR